MCARSDSLLSERGIQITCELLLGLPGETIDTVKAAVDESLALPTTVVGYTLGFQVFPHAPLGVRFAAESDGVNMIPGLQSNTALSPIFLKPLEKCSSLAEYERQFWWDEAGRSRPVFYFSPDLPEDPETIASPSGRWVNTIRWIQDYVPKSEHYRVRAADGLRRRRGRQQLRRQPVPPPSRGPRVQGRLLLLVAPPGGDPGRGPPSRRHRLTPGTPPAPPFSFCE